MLFCHMRLSSYPQLASRKAFTVSLVGVVAVKFAGSGLGNVGGPVGAGAAGAASCGGAAGTCCCAKTAIERDEANSAVAPAIPDKRRIKQNLLRKAGRT